MKPAECYTYGQKRNMMDRGPPKLKQFIKKGTFVDGECKYANVSHVHRAPTGNFYMCTLTKTDLVHNVNSYYKIQLLRHDVPGNNEFYLFHSWGRIGTDVGGKTTDCYDNEGHAVSAFENLFYEKTGNLWNGEFHKKPGKFGLIHMDYSEVEHIKTNLAPGALSNLHPSIINIMNMICDVDQMKVVMKKYELDLNKMPLGKLSKRQITQAYEVLTQLWMVYDTHNNTDAIIDATNRFYTLIPHNFGMNPPKPLSRFVDITEKWTMLDTLKEIVETMATLKTNQQITVEQSRDIIDVHYEKLHCKMEYVAPTDYDYKIIKQYLSDTHGKTHSNYTLELKDTGYMFGKGIYFADMCSKSANYARVNKGPGLILLCDVALGRIQHEVHGFDGNESLKPEYDSVKGSGENYLDPNGFFKHSDGYTIPLGKQQTNNQAAFSLLYNEYVVYDVSQVRLKYLLHVNFS